MMMRKWRKGGALFAQTRGGGICLYGINEQLWWRGGSFHMYANETMAEEAIANAGINVLQWDEEAMPQNTNKLAHFFARISLLPVFTHISQRFSSEGPR